MRSKTFFLGLALAIVEGEAGAAETQAKPSIPVVTATVPMTNQVIAYYFHGTVRCETCLKIEKQAKAAIERQFKTELADRRLVFKPVNYEQPENAHFLQDYKLPCPSLVLVWRLDGRDKKWKLLGDTWELIEDPEKFDRYVETETNKLLREAK